MPLITAKTAKRPSGPYWYWTTLGPKNVNLADRIVDLPAGEYLVSWDVRGNPGDELLFTLSDVKGVAILRGGGKIPDGRFDHQGSVTFVVPPSDEQLAAANAAAKFA